MSASAVRSSTRKIPTEPVNSTVLAPTQGSQHESKAGSVEAMRRRYPLGNVTSRARLARAIEFGERPRRFVPFRQVSENTTKQGIACRKKNRGNCPASAPVALRQAGSAEEFNHRFTCLLAEPLDRVGSHPVDAAGLPAFVGGFPSINQIAPETDGAFRDWRRVSHGAGEGRGDGMDEWTCRAREPRPSSRGLGCGQGCEARPHAWLG